MCAWHLCLEIVAKIIIIIVIFITYLFWLICRLFVAHCARTYSFLSLICLHLCQQTHASVISYYTVSLIRTPTACIIARTYTQFIFVTYIEIFYLLLHIKSAAKSFPLAYYLHLVTFSFTDCPFPPRDVFDMH